VKNRVWIILLVVSLGINIGFLLHWAWPRITRGGKAGFSSGWHASPMMRHLGLSCEQARRMEHGRRQVLEQARPLQEALRQKRRELFVLLKRRDVRDADLDATVNEISRLQAALEKMFILHSLEVRSVFSSAQLRKYEGCLERGLCPGMTAGASCSFSKGPGKGTDACANLGKKNKQSKKR
jgi:hypothetical protein